MDIQYITQQARPVLQKHGVVRAAIFGSAARGDMTQSSDIDFLVELPSNVHGYDYVALRTNLADELKDTLGKNIDLTEYKLIKPRLKSYILPTQVQIL